MIKVLHVTNAYPYAETPEYGVFVKEQIESLPASQVENKLLFVNGRANGKKAYLSAMREVRRNLDDIDVIHCHHAYSLLVVILAGAAGKLPIVLSFLNDWTYEVKGLRFEWLKKTVCRICVRLSTKVIFKSPIPTELKNSRKAINLPNGVDGDFFSIRDRNAAKGTLNLEIDSNYLLFVSSKNQYREQKRYDIFQKVLERVRTLRPDLRAEEIVMVGQARERVPLIFAASAVHVLTSDYEGSPNSVKEALCCGTSVVARDVGNVIDMLQGVPGTTVVPSSDPDMLAQAVIGILDHKERPELIRAKFLEKGITKKIVAERLIDVYREAISRHIEK